MREAKPRCRRRRTASSIMSKNRFTKFPIAEKNLLKIFCSNRNIQLQVVNNRSGHIFLSASTLEKQLRETLKNTSDRVAARATAGLLVRRAREAGHQQITWERNGMKYAGKVKVIIETLREHGMEFVQHAFKRPVKFPWDRTPKPPASPTA